MTEARLKRNGIAHDTFALPFDWMKGPFYVWVEASCDNTPRKASALTRPTASSPMHYEQVFALFT